MATMWLLEVDGICKTLSTPALTLGTKSICDIVDRTVLQAQRAFSSKNHNMY